MILHLLCGRSCPAAPQEDEYGGPCAVRGHVPPWLRGTLYRIGPGLWEVRRDGGRLGGAAGVPVRGSISPDGGPRPGLCRAAILGNDAPARFRAWGDPSTAGIVRIDGFCALLRALESAL